jgi:hypothetical protein
MTPVEFQNLLMAICGFLLTGIAAWFVLEFREMRKSVEMLNLQIAQIILKIETHETRIERLEEISIK